MKICPSRKVYNSKTYIFSPIFFLGKSKPFQFVFVSPKLLNQVIQCMLQGTQLYVYISTLALTRSLISKSHHHMENNPLVQYQWIEPLSHIPPLTSSQQEGHVVPKYTSHHTLLWSQTGIAMPLMALYLCPKLPHSCGSWSPSLKNQPMKVAITILHQYGP